MISLLSIIPVREEAADSSEMVTQLLFGEEVQVLERVDNWTKITTLHDNYTGWVDTKMLSAGHAATEFMVVTSVTAQIKCGGEVFTIMMGSKIPKHEGTFTLGHKDYEWVSGEYAEPHLSISEALKLMASLKNAPYLWGGRTPFGIDCSGFSQLFYRLVGQEIPRDASQQIALGNVVFLTEAEPGDLAFFQKNGRITHVGVLLDNNTIMHASGWLRIDTIDANGIYVDSTTGYTHELVDVIRLS